jgi:CSLREA domain-containing protein
MATGNSIVQENQHPSISERWLSWSVPFGCRDPSTTFASPPLDGSALTDSASLSRVSAADAIVFLENRPPSPRRWATSFLIFAMVLAGAPNVHAAALVVNTLTDESVTDGNCWLREAVTAANTNTPRAKLWMFIRASSEVCWVFGAFQQNPRSADEQLSSSDVAWDGVLGLHS